MLLDPPVGTPSGLGRSIVHAGGTVPFAARTSVAAAIDDDERAYALAATVKPWGRVVGPLNVPVPPEVRELTRDDRWWVGEKENATAPVELTRRAR